MNPTPKTDEIDAYFGMPTDPAALAYRKLCGELEWQMQELRKECVEILSERYERAELKRLRDKYPDA